MTITGERSRIFVTGLRGIPHIMGGVESHCEEIFSRFLTQSDDFHVTILARSTYAGQQSYQYSGIDIIPLPAMKSMYLEALTSTFLGIFYARWKRADLLHIHAIGPALLTPLARLMGMRVIVTHHGEDYVRDKWGKIARAVLRMGERTAMKWAHRIIAVSPTIHARLEKDYPEDGEKAVFIPNGVPDLSLPPEESRQIVTDFGLQPGRYILGVGRLVPEKEFHTLIDAFEKRVDEMPGMKLAIVGDADFPTPYSKALKNRCSDRIVFLGKLRRHIAGALYRHSHCFVLPSSHEALAIVALEAASCGATLIASDIAANLNFGLLPEAYFPLRDSDALGELLVTPPATPTHVRKAMLDAFDWDASALSTERVYRETLETGRASMITLPQEALES